MDLDAVRAERAEKRALIGEQIRGLEFEKPATAEWQAGAVLDAFQHPDELDEFSADELSRLRAHAPEAFGRMAQRLGPLKPSAHLHHLMQRSIANPERSGPERPEPFTDEEFVGAVSSVGAKGVLPDTALVRLTDDQVREMKTNRHKDLYWRSMHALADSAGRPRAIVQNRRG